MNSERSASVVRGILVVILSVIWIVAVSAILSGCVTYEYRLTPPKFAYMSCVVVTGGWDVGMVGRIAARLPPTRYRIFNDIQVAEVEETNLAPYPSVGDVCEEKK